METHSKFYSASINLSRGKFNLTASASIRDNKFTLELLIPNYNNSIKVEWDNRDIKNLYFRQNVMGMSANVTIDSKTSIPVIVGDRSCYRSDNVKTPLSDSIPDIWDKVFNHMDSAMFPRINVIDHAESLIRLRMDEKGPEQFLTPNGGTGSAIVEYVECVAAFAGLGTLIGGVPGGGIGMFVGGLVCKDQLYKKTGVETDEYGFVK